MAAFSNQFLLLKMNLKHLTTRLWFLLGFIGCFGLLAAGAFMQFVLELEPCPLCISQRLAILTTGIVFLLAAIHNKAAPFYSVAGAVSALIGASISARHVWLQNLPPEQVPECSPGLEYVFQNFPLADTIKLMLSGTGECAEIDGYFLGLTIPGWTLVAFLLISVFSLAALKIQKTQTNQS
jgi:disulfide bond formation protein DsbB